MGIVHVVKTKYFKCLPIVEFYICMRDYLNADKQAAVYVLHVRMCVLLLLVLSKHVRVYSYIHRSKPQHCGFT